MTWHDVGAEEGHAPGTARSVLVGETRVAVFRTQDGWAAFDDVCPHAGAPLSEGALRDGALVCAWHGWTFDGATGACRSVPGARGAARRAVRVEAGRVLVGGPTPAAGPASGSRPR